jgi:hypothetical protein
MESSSAAMEDKTTMMNNTIMMESKEPRDIITDEIIKNKHRNKRFIRRIEILYRIMFGDDEGSDDELVESNDDLNGKSNDKLSKQTIAKQRLSKL